MEQIWRNVFVDALNSNRGKNVVLMDGRRVIVPQSLSDFLDKLFSTFRGVPRDANDDVDYNLRDVGLTEDFYLAFPDETKLRPWMNRVERVYGAFDAAEMDERADLERLLDPQAVMWTTVQTLCLVMVGSFLVSHLLTKY